MGGWIPVIGYARQGEQTMNWDMDLNYPLETACETDLQMELIELRQAVASALGRNQYAYNLLDEALETGHLESMQRARHEFDQLGEDVRARILDAAGATS